MHERNVTCLHFGLDFRDYPSQCHEQYLQGETGRSLHLIFTE